MSGLWVTSKIAVAVDGVTLNVIEKFVYGDLLNRDTGLDQSDSTIALICRP